MPTYQGTITFLPLSTSGGTWTSTTRGTFSTALNQVQHALTAVGMVRASAADFPGQCGLFSASDPPEAGQTALPTLFAGANILAGFQVYVHPGRGWHLKVDFIIRQFGTSWANCRHISFQFSVCPDASFQPEKTITFNSHAGCSATPISTLLTGPDTGFSATLMASCGPDHLWVYAQKAGAYVGLTSQNYALPMGFCLLGFGLFFPEDGSEAAVLVAPVPSPPATSSFLPMQQGSAPLLPTMPASRCWTYDYLTSRMRARVEGSFCRMQEPGEGRVDSVLIEQAGLWAAGEYRRYGFGVIPSGAAADAALVNFSMDGGPSKTWCMATAIGPCNIARWLNNVGSAPSLADFCNPVFPWNNG